MIASNFVSCYRCAGEGSDRRCGSVSGAGFWVDHQASSKQSRSQKLEARVLYSLIDFFSDLYCSHIYNTEPRVGSSGWDEGGRGVGGGWLWDRGKDQVKQCKSSSSAGEKEGCDTWKQMKHRNDDNRSVGRSLDCCSAKLLEFNHVWVWDVTAGCNTPMRHHRSPLGQGPYRVSPNQTPADWSQTTPLM